MKNILLCLFIVTALTVNAQTKLSLKEAIKTGIKNNLGVNQAEILSKQANIILNQSKASMLPSLNATADHGVNQGRSIDPISNSFVNQQFSYASYGANSNLLLFNGFSLNNKVKENSLSFQATKMELQQSKDNLTINIILAYLLVLSSNDILERSKQQAAVTRKQVERLEIMNNAGSITPATYYDLKGQLANDEIAIADNYAAVENAKLALVQLLNIPYNKALQLERLPEELFNIEYLQKPDSVYQKALTQFAQIKATGLRTQSLSRQVRSIKGELFPTLFLGGNINSNYASAASQPYFINSVDVQGSDYVIINGTQQPVFTKQENYGFRKINYGTQLNNNLFTSVNLGLSVPLFNGSRVRSRINIAKLNLRNSELVENQTKNALQQAIEQAYVNLTNTSDKYKLLTGQVAAFTESFRGAEVRFNAGAINAVDYLIAKNNLDRSMNNLIIAKYDFVLRTKIMDYYEGKALW